MRAFLRTSLIVLAMAIAGYIGWDRVEASRLTRAIKAIAARGEPIDLSALQAPLPSPAHQEAAQLYVEAASRAQDIASRDFGFPRFDVDAVVGHVDVAAWEDTYRKDAPALQLLDRAVTLPFAGFGDAFDGPDWLNVRGLQALGALAALRADLLAYRGNGEAASSALIAALGVQRTLPDLTNRYFVSLRHLGSLRILLRHTAPPPASLEALQRAFTGLPDEDELDRDLMLRRARLIEQANTFAPGRVPAAAAFVFHPFLTRQVRVQIEQFPDVIAAAREPWPDKYVTLRALAAADAPRSNRSVLRSALAGETVNVAALSAAPAQAGLNLATRRVAVTALAIERYRRAHDGALPPSLDALVPAFLPVVPIDPFSGHAIVFKPSSDSYLVYSLDADRTDSGGALYGTGSMNPMPLPRQRDFGIKVPLRASGVQLQAGSR